MSKTIILEDDDADAMLQLAKDLYEEFRQDYEKGIRNYHKQQLAERVGRALGCRLGMENLTASTYKIVCEPYKPPTTVL
jgi:hypothetical protein